MNTIFLLLLFILSFFGSCLGDCPSSSYPYSLSFGESFTGQIGSSSSSSCYWYVSSYSSFYLRLQTNSLTSYETVKVFTSYNGNRNYLQYIYSSTSYPQSFYISGGSTVYIEYSTTATSSSRGYFTMLVSSTTGSCGGSTCDTNAYCYSGSCYCNSGYTGTGTSCSRTGSTCGGSTCDWNARCISSSYSYSSYCSCNSGYSGTGTSCTSESGSYSGIGSSFDWDTVIMLPCFGGGIFLGLLALFVSLSPNVHLRHSLHWAAEDHSPELIQLLAQGTPSPPSPSPPPLAQEENAAGSPPPPEPNIVYNFQLETMRLRFADCRKHCIRQGLLILFYVFVFWLNLGFVLDKTPTLRDICSLYTWIDYPVPIGVICFAWLGLCLFRATLAFWNIIAGIKWLLFFKRYPTNGKETQPKWFGVGGRRNFFIGLGQTGYTGISIALVATYAVSTDIYDPFFASLSQQMAGKAIFEVVTSIACFFIILIVSIVTARQEPKKIWSDTAKNIFEFFAYFGSLYSLQVQGAVTFDFNNPPSPVVAQIDGQLPPAVPFNLHPQLAVVQSGQQQPGGGGVAMQPIFPQQGGGAVLQPIFPQQQLQPAGGVALQQIFVQQQPGANQPAGWVALAPQQQQQQQQIPLAFPAAPALDDRLK